MAGAKPMGTLSGSPVNGAIREYPVDASNATAIFRGDFVVLEDDGNVAPASAGGNLLGVCVGIEVDRSVPATEHPGYLPATTAGYVKVAVGPDILYEVEEDGVGGYAPVTVVGSNADIVAGAGSATTGNSGHQLDSSDAIAKDAAPGVAQLRIVALSRKEGVAAGDSSARWVVRINESQFDLGGAGL